MENTDNGVLELLATAMKAMGPEASHRIYHAEEGHPGWGPLVDRKVRVIDPSFRSLVGTIATVTHDWHPGYIDSGVSVVFQDGDLPLFVDDTEFELIEEDKNA